LHNARQAAEHGQKELMLLHFPSQLCSDGGRAINAVEPNWPRSLRGEAAEIYLRWERDLKPHGFRWTRGCSTIRGECQGRLAFF
jgi:hypothetical protein